MKKGTFSIILFLSGFLFLFPLQTDALEKLKTCTYETDSSQVVVTMYNDYSVDANLTRINGKKQLQKLTTNWSQLSDFVRESSSAKCPAYSVVASNLQEVNFSNNKKSAAALAKTTAGDMLSLKNEEFIDNKDGLNEEIMSCDYQFTNADKRNVKLSYKIFSNGRVGLPFADNVDYLNNGKTWYHADNFSNKFYNSSHIGDATFTCPSLLIQESSLGVTVYPNGNGKCSGNCYNVSAKSNTLSNTAKKKGIKTKKVVSSCTGSSVGLYNSKSYFFPYFRLYSDGSREWSIDGETFVDISKKITGKVNKKSVELTMNSSLVSEIFKSGSVSCPTKIYRCVNKKGDGYSYELSTSATACSKDELGSLDGQGFGSAYASGAFGDPTGDADDNQDELTLDDLREDLNSYNKNADCNSLLGSTQDKESVAWLLQQILNYIKILGPILVVILSGMDFAKVIVTSDDDSMKKAQKKLVVRLCAAVALFFIPTLVSVLLTIFGITTDQICGLQ